MDNEVAIAQWINNTSQIWSSLTNLSTQGPKFSRNSNFRVSTFWDGQEFQIGKMFEGHKTFQVVNIIIGSKFLGVQHFQASILSGVQTCQAFKY